MPKGFRPAPVNINYADYFPWHAKRLLAGEIVNVDVKDLPSDAEIDRASAANIGIQSILVIPLKVSGSLAYVLVANTVRNERRWEVEFVPRIRLLGESFVDALTRKDAEERIHDQLTFERLVSDISASFVNASPEHVDPAIEMGLNRLLEFFDLDHCSLISIGTDARTAVVTHAAHTEGVVAPPAQIDFAHDFPWLSSRLFARETVWASVDELPAEAEIDRKTAIQLGIKSFLLVPLRVDGFVSHVLAATSLRSTGAWPDTVISRIRLLAEIFTSALARKRAQAQLVQSYAQIQELKNRLEAEAEYLRSEIQVAYHYEDIIGESRPILEVLAQVEQVAPTGSSVLILGETGTGKELVARAIHNLSHRRARAMVKVSCASLPSTLIESELFGREKGAYTGALTRQMGRFELADESTLFLDEIGELSQDLQIKLLRVLQEGEFERLGSPRTIKVNVRVIAATNRNLLQAVQKGSFRQDLYYRLNVFPIRVPTLRERPKDIPLLISAFLSEFGLKMSKKIDVIPKPTMDALIRYPWPGNIRELRNVIEHAVIISNGSRLTVQLPEDPTVTTGGRLTLEDVERKHILDTLESTGWVIKGPRGAATILRLKPSTLYNKMKKLEIVRPEKP